MCDRSMSRYPLTCASRIAEGAPPVSCSSNQEGTWTSYCSAWYEGGARSRAEENGNQSYHYVLSSHWQLSSLSPLDRQEAWNQSSGGFPKAQSVGSGVGTQVIGLPSPRNFPLMFLGCCL